MTPAQVIEYIDTHCAEYLDLPCDSVTQVRGGAIKQIRSYLERYGFPTDPKTRQDLCLAPFFFQEALYDDVYWEEQVSDLGPLQPFFEIEFMVVSEGVTRRGATKDQFEHYLSLARGSIRRARS
jgi:hypothetical protein